MYIQIGQYVSKPYYEKVYNRIIFLLSMHYGIKHRWIHVPRFQK